MYNSGYSSYNPPNAGPVGPPNDNPGIAYPPNIMLPSDNNNNKSPAEGYSYNPPQKLENSVSYPSLGPPLAPPAPNNGKTPNNENNNEDALYYAPSGEKDTETILDHPPPGWKDSEPSDDMTNNQHNNHDNIVDHHSPPSWDKPKQPSGDQSDDHQETILDYPPPGWKDPNAQMGGNDMKAMGMGPDMAEDDLAPPPAPSQNFAGQFPSYVYNGAHDQGHDFGSYDFDHHHHHVYKEVTTTTTTEAPEDERVNKGHYSYYYLGRKLWYIPLYFSVYFIIYVTVLILKSIARHKIQLKHEHFARDKDKGRSLDLNDLNDLHQNVTEGIEQSRRKFTYVAM